ncbi:hypothetical protein BURPS668_A1945 [Burkholderia pseudomallei 668]|nr:hypothetical protein BURPS668_A1945 [Burkholderia pseudomallei 668]
MRTSACDNTRFDSPGQGFSDKQPLSVRSRPRAPALGPPRSACNSAHLEAEQPKLNRAGTHSRV